MWSDAFSGGLLIGSSAVLLMLAQGRIAGISGISWQAVRQVFQADSPSHWRYWFLAGLIGGSGMMYLSGNFMLPAVPDVSTSQVVIAGLLVGFGSHLGSGCTSGHGVCGLGRLSVRSLVATLTFLLAGFGSVYMLKLIRGS